MMIRQQEHPIRILLIVPTTQIATPRDSLESVAPQLQAEIWVAVAVNRPWKEVLRIQPPKLPKILLMIRTATPPVPFMKRAKQPD